ncbi:hypothetical protein [Kitasatospora cineracea]|uniref:hypothetical protein n=1 Tax=Kitasatospora cineracea TaxID=88074 RepID=UPI00367C4D0D
MGEQPITVHHVRAGARTHRIVQVPQRPGRLALRDEQHWLTLYADRAGLARLVAAWSLAARSPHSLLHLPLRGHPLPDGPSHAPMYPGGHPVLDLVLAHHSLQFRPSAWKDLRSRLGPGRPQRAATPAADFPAGPRFADRFPHPDFRDHLHFALAAATLFVTASAPAFRDSGTALHTLLTQAPAAHHHDLAHPSPRHKCTDLTTAPTRFPTPHTAAVPSLLHVQYCPDWTYA